MYVSGIWGVSGKIFPIRRNVARNDDTRDTVADLLTEMVATPSVSSSGEPPAYNNDGFEVQQRRRAPYREIHRDRRRAPLTASVSDGAPGSPKLRKMEASNGADGHQLTIEALCDILTPQSTKFMESSTGDVDEPAASIDASSRDLQANEAWDAAPQVRAARLVYGAVNHMFSM